MINYELFLMIFLPLHFLINGILLGYQISINDISVNTTKQKIIGCSLLLLLGWFWFLLLTIYYLLRNLYQNDYIFLIKAIIGINGKRVRDMGKMGLYSHMKDKMQTKGKFYNYLCEHVITKYKLDEDNNNS